MRYLRYFFSSYLVLNSLIVGGSILLCFILSLSRLPGMEILGVGPNWLVIWLVTWSLSHSRFQSLVAATSLALVLDGMTSSYPTHLIGLLGVAWLSTTRGKRARLHYSSSYSMILVMLRVFFLVFFVEATIAIQYYFINFSFLDELWLNYQKIALSCAVLSSLWTPFLYYPLNRWWNSSKRPDPV